ncbi:Uncharacterised protein [Halioglobus japonicus]|nr:Uncharacterised protein [Halioglobus japonicus]
MNFIKPLSILAILSVTYACSHPIEIRGKGAGDVVSYTATRDCYLEDYQQGLTNCSENLVTGAYDETYTAVPRADAQFRRWGNYCDNATTNECSFNVTAGVVKKFYFETLPPLQAIFRPKVNTGFKMVSFGHSFFNPMAMNLEGHAHAAGFTDHETIHFSAGGSNGAPMAFWNNNTVRPQIQAELDSGDIDLVGMTYYPSYPTIDGYRNWVEYALSKNPDTRFFIALPWNIYPADVTAAEYESDYDTFHPQISHAFIDTLREEFPGVDFYCIPYGQSAVELRNLYADGTLTSNGDVATLQGSANSALFTDNLGHAGDILIELSSLLWLEAIYGVDLSNYNYNTGYTTDLKAIASDIIATHELAYAAPPETYPDSDDDGIPDRYEAN